jgi:membrane-bound lytic murein transglycosylase F
MTASVPLRRSPGSGTGILSEAPWDEVRFELRIRGFRAPHRPAVSATLGAVTVLAALGTLAGAGLLVLAGCKSQPSALDRIRERGEIKVVTLNIPTCYYLGAQGTEGLEFEVAREFARQLGVSLVIYPVASDDAMREALTTGRADIAAAQITPDDKWREAGDASAPYGRIPQLVVYRRDTQRPRSTLQLESARLAVRAGSAQEHLLEKMRRTVAPNLQWVETAPTSADPLDDVDSGEANFALIDAREYTFAHHLYPKVTVGFALPESRPVQWMVRHDAHDLVRTVNRFFEKFRSSGRLAKLQLRETGDSRTFAYEESREFQGNMTERLPHYRPLFEAAAKESGIDWRLLAAVGYQESKWDPVAQSSDGALGVMMLTSDTADAMGIHDRTNPEQSIIAGARYLAEVREKVPERIPEPDRTWLTVAAYNVGFGHLEDARVIAQALGKNPDSWVDVRDCLPLLAQERWFLKAKRGYARGWEPVQFVDRVQRYLTLLEWQPGEAMANESTTVDMTPPWAHGGN